MHNVRNLGSKTFSINFKDRLMSFFLIVIFFVIFIFFKAEAIIGNFSETKIDIELAMRLLIEEFDSSSEIIFDQIGIASWYGKPFHKRKTANGERYNMYDYTAAHKKLPFGTILKVTNTNTDQSVLVRINDRGPFIRKRIIDLSYTSAKDIDGIGLSDVKIEGFLPGSADSLTEISKDIFFGYSYKEKLICIPKNVVFLMDSASNYNDAIRKYQSYLTLYPKSTSYLFVSADKLTRRENHNEYNYFIGTLNLDYLFDNLDIAKR